MLLLKSSRQRFTAALVCAVVDAFIGGNAQIDNLLFCFVWFHVIGSDWLLVLPAGNEKTIHHALNLINTKMQNF
jgi:hypothetical protein